MNKGSNSSHISVKNACDFLSQLKAQADEERSSTTAGYISKTATEDSFKSLTGNYHYDENADQVPCRARDSENRGTSASRIDGIHYRSDILIYDVPVTKESVTIGKTTKSEDEVYHSHVIHTVSGSTSKDIYNGVNYKAQKLMDKEYKDADHRDSSMFKPIEEEEDPLVAFTRPWTSNSDCSENIQKQAEEIEFDLIDAMLQREEYHATHPVEYTKDYGVALEEVLKEEKTEVVAKMSTSELKATRDKAIEVKMTADPNKKEQSSPKRETDTSNLVSYFSKSFETSCHQQSRETSAPKSTVLSVKQTSVNESSVSAAKTESPKQDTTPVRSYTSYSLLKSESIKHDLEPTRDNLGSTYERTDYVSEKTENTSSYSRSYVSSKDSSNEIQSKDCSATSSYSSDSLCGFSSREDEDEEDHSAEAEAKRSSCSWWYHGRCLQNEDDCYNCQAYDSCPHNCANCSSFSPESGSNRKGDSWNGICEAYGGNPIRHDPSSHTCKAWN